MMEVEIPGFKTLHLEHLVLDYNGTISRDGELIAGIKDALEYLSGSFTIHVVTGDTFGKAGRELQGLPCQLTILPAAGQDKAKLAYIKKLDTEHTVCIGNGRNDRQMLKEAALGIAVIQEEGAAVEALSAADIVCTEILSALKLLMNPLRLKATLRS